MTSFAESWKAFLDVLGLSGRMAAVVLVFAGFALFAPSDWLKFLDVDHAAATYRPWVGIAAIASTAILLVDLAKFSYSTWKSWIKEVSARRAQRKRREVVWSKVAEKVGNLNAAEKAILREFAQQDLVAVKMPVDNGSVQHLIECGLLRVMQNVGDVTMAGLMIHVELTDPAKEYLTKEVLDWNEAKAKELPRAFWIGRRY